VHLWGSETEKRWMQTVFGGMAMVYPTTPLGVRVLGRGGAREFDVLDIHSNRTFPTTDDDGTTSTLRLTRSITSEKKPRKTDDEAMPPRDAAAAKVFIISVTELVSSPTVTVFSSYFGIPVFDHISGMENAQLGRLRTTSATRATKSSSGACTGWAMC